MEINEFITFAEFSYKKCGKWKQLNTSVCPQGEEFTGDSTGCVAKKLHFGDEGYKGKPAPVCTVERCEKCLDDTYCEKCATGFEVHSYYENVVCYETADAIGDVYKMD